MPQISPARTGRLGEELRAHPRDRGTRSRCTRRAQDADPAGRRGALRRRRSRAVNIIKVHGQAEAARRVTRARGRAGRRPSSSSRPATRSRSSKERRSSMAIRRVQADVAGPPLHERSRLRGDHEDEAGEVACSSRSTKNGRPEQPRPHHDAAPGRRPQAALPHHRLQARQGRRPGEGRRDRVRPEPLGAHRAAPLRRRREALHPRAGSASRSATRSSVRADADIKPGNALPLENIPIGTLVHDVELKPGQGAQMARSAGLGASSSSRRTRRLRRPPPSLRRDAPRRRRRAGRPSARSATSTTRTSRSARPAAAAGSASARTCAARR